MVKEQSAQCLVIWHIAPLGLLARVVIVLLVVDSLSFDNYFWLFAGNFVCKGWFGTEGLEKLILVIWGGGVW